MQTIYGVTSGENIVQAFTEENTTEANFHQSINNAAILTFTTTEPLKAGVQFFLTKDPINDYKNEEFMYFEITDQDFDGYEHTYRAEEYAYHDLDTMGYVKKVYTQGRWTTRSLLESIVYNDVEPKGVARTKWEIIDNDLTLPTTWAGEGNTYTLWYNTPLRGIEKFIEYFGGEVRFYVTIFDNKISRHYLEIYEKRGRETGKRYESNSNLISLTNKAEYDNRYEYIIPLAEGGGASGDEQTHNTPNGFNNYITLEGLEVGKPTDKWYKPKSQMYISLANDKGAYPLKAQPKGLQNNPRIKPVTFEEVKSKQALFNKAIEWLENNQGVAWSYSASVLDIGESQVGDTIAIIDERSGISSYVRVHDIDYDMIDPENTGVHFGSNWGYENDEAITDMLNTATAARHDTIGLIDTAIRQSNGKNTNYYGANEPADPTAGDLWYKQAGDETYLMIFKDGKWVELVSTRTQEAIADAVDEATSEANSYADSLNATQASEAASFQSEANAALSSAAAERKVFSSNAASMATSAATHADSMANSAAAYGKAQASSALSSANVALSEAETRINTTTGSAAKSMVDTATATAHSEAQQVAQSANQALADAKKDLGDDIQKNHADIVATQEELSSKVSQSDYDTKTKDLDTKYAQVKQTADGVTTDVASYKLDNDKKVSANTAQLKVVSDEVSSKVSQTEYNQKTSQIDESVSQLKQRADGFESTVTKVNNLAVGGRNYIPNSDLKIVQSDGVPYPYKSNLGTTVNGSEFSHKMVTTSLYVDIKNITSFSNGFNRVLMELIFFDVDGNKLYVSPSTSITQSYLKVGDSFSGRITAFKNLTNVDIDPNKGVSVGIYIQGIKADYIEASRPKLEIGTIATDWTPAPEDVQSGIETNTSSITQLADEVKTKVAKSDYDKNNQTLNNSISTVSQKADGVRADVEAYQKTNDGKVSSNTAAIDVNSKAITTKVSQSDYDKKTKDLDAKYGQVKTTADAVTADVASYKSTNDKKVNANTASINVLNNQITSKVSQTDYDKETQSLEGKYSIQQQTIEGISQTVTELQAKANAQGQVNQLLNTEFTPDLENWDIGATNSSDRQPYRSYISAGSNLIAFDTRNNAENSRATLSQIIPLGATSSTGRKVSLSWYSRFQENANYGNIHVYALDSNKTSLTDEFVSFDNTHTNAWSTGKFEGIDMPDEARYVQVMFIVREGVYCFLGKPMLVFSDTVGDYVMGNYNNNNRVAALEIDVDGISGLVNDPKKGLSATATLAANGMTIATSAQSDASSAIQTAKGLQTQVTSNDGDIKNLQSTTSQTAGQVTTEIQDRKDGDTNILTQAKGFTSSQISDVTEGYQSAIQQSANGIIASISMPNKLFNTEFTPDLDGWDIGSTNSDTSKPYKSYMNGGSNLVAFDTRSNPSNTRATMAQTIPLGTSAAGRKVSLGWRSRWVQNDNYVNVHVYMLDSNQSDLSDVYMSFDQTHDGTWSDGKFESIDVPDDARYVKVVFMVREGAYGWLGKPMLVFDISISTYMPGSYSSMNTSTVLELFKDNWALGIADNAGRLISGINGDTSGTVIQGKKLVINSDTTITGKAFIDGSVIKNASISTAQIGNAAIGSAQIINVDVSKISGNIANFITANVDRLNARVLYGDTGHLGTTDTGRVINKQDNHLQLASKGMYNSANDRAQVELLSHTNDIDANMRGSFNYYSDVRKGHGLGIRLVQNQILAIDEDGGSKMLYLSPYQGGEVRVVSRDKKAYYPMRASSFNAMSSRSAKSNIKPFEDCALDIVKKTKVRTYVKSGKQEIGVISDEADPRMLTDDDNAVSLYDYTSILYKAVQELSAQVAELQKERPNDY